MGRVSHSRWFPVHFQTFFNQCFGKLFFPKNRPSTSCWFQLLSPLDSIIKRACSLPRPPPPPPFSSNPSPSSPSRSCLCPGGFFFTTSLRRPTPPLAPPSLFLDAPGRDPWPPPSFQIRFIPPARTVGIVARRWDAVVPLLPSPSVPLPSAADWRR